jgi:hypothetical protein
MLQRLLQNSLCFQVFGGYVAIFHVSIFFSFFFWMNNMKYSVLTMRSLVTSLIVRGSTHTLCFKLFDILLLN